MYSCHIDGVNYIIIVITETVYNKFNMLGLAWKWLTENQKYLKFDSK